MRHLQCGEFLVPIACKLLHVFQTAKLSALQVIQLALEQQISVAQLQANGYQWTAWVI